MRKTTKKKIAPIAVVVLVILYIAPLMAVVPEMRLNTSAAFS